VRVEVFTAMKLWSSALSCFVMMWYDTNVTKDYAVSIFTLKVEAASLHDITTWETTTWTFHNKSFFLTKICCI